MTDGPLQRPTNRLDLLKLICDMREMGLPDPYQHPAFRPVCLTANTCDEIRRWLEGFWSGYDEGREAVLEKLLEETHQPKDIRRCWVCGGPYYHPPPCRVDLVDVKVHAIAEAQRILWEARDA